MGDEFDVEETQEPEEQELLVEMEKEQVLTDMVQLMENEVVTPDYCVTCFYNPENNGECPVLDMMAGLIKTHNGIYKVNPQIDRIESRWGCTSHKQLKHTPLLPE